MWLQFFAENAHFAIDLFVALILFAISWLYFDAWITRKNFKDGAKIVGLFLLCLSYIVAATVVESTMVQTTFFGSGVSLIVIAVLRVVGYIFLILGLSTDPLQPHPKLTLLFPFNALYFLFSYPILSAVTGFLFLRRATIGLEKHLKPIAFGFYLLAISDLFGLAPVLRTTSNVNLFKIVAPFGILWVFEHVVLLFAGVVLGRWVYYYLLERLQTQMFMILTTSILVIFLATTTTFTGLLLKNLQDETLSRLTTDVKVLSYAVDSKRNELTADSEVLSGNAQVIQALTDGSRVGLATLTESTLLKKKESTLVIVNGSGVVEARGEDKERIGDSISDDPLIKRALLGETATSVVTHDGALFPQVSVRAVSPVRSLDDKIVGAVLTGYTIDNSFLDGIKKATGLEASVYGDDTLSATTITSSDGTSRYLGTKLENGKKDQTNIKDKVLTKGESFSGPATQLNTPYFASYLPLKDVDNNPIGILSVAKPQVGVLMAAGKSIELTFVLAAILLVLSVIPSYFISRYISKQLS